MTRAMTSMTPEMNRVAASFVPKRSEISPVSRAVHPGQKKGDGCLHGEAHNHASEQGDGDVVLGSAAAPREHVAVGVFGGTAYAVTTTPTP